MGVGTRDSLTILAVDDERTQLEDLARLLRSCSGVEDVECAFDGRDALVKASAHQYDAIFLDVRMPGLDGVELGRVMRRFALPPQLVFVSAYENAAVDAFELHAVDYLRKPVSRRRVQEALDRVLAAVERPDGEQATGEMPVPPGTPGSDIVPVTNSHTGAIRLINRASILYVHSQGDFVRVVTPEARYLLRSTLSEIERRWAQFGFVRVHRQYLANLLRAFELRPQLGGTAELVFEDGQTIPIARRHVTELSRRLGV